MNEFDKLKKCLDMDRWIYTMHNRLETKEDFIKAKEIIEGKIKTRLNDLSLLTNSYKYVKTQIEDVEIPYLVVNNDNLKDPEDKK